MIKKVFNFLNTVLGMPYYLFLNTLKGAYKGLKGLLKGFMISFKFTVNIP